MSAGRRRPPSRRPQAAGDRTPRGSARVRADTIAAISTAPGRGAVAIIRVSGPAAEQIGRRVLDPWPTEGRRMCRCAVHDPDDPARVLDDALAVVFPGPASYTGETVLEVHTHGGSYVPVAVYEAVIAAGARPALAGEFTERAVLNGRLDLIRAETVAELIEARTGAAHRAAINALSGALTHTYGELRADAIALEALLAYDIDFPDEDHGPLARDRILEAAAVLAARIRVLVNSAPAAALARNGALVVLAGPPNAGKSTLFNTLVGETRAIVSERAGTTRDAIEVLLDSEPWPMRLIDTAGLRTSDDAVERLGIEVSERYLRSADVVVLCAESRRELDVARTGVTQLSGAPVVCVRTKSDVPDAEASEGHADGIVEVCAPAGTGIPRLRQAIVDAISTRAGSPTELPVAAVSARQRAALERAGREIDQFVDAWRSGTLPAPVAGTHVRGAIDALEDLIGSVDADDILARVFSTFCVGK